MTVTKDQLIEAQEYISGTCMLSPEVCLSTVLKRDATEEEVDEFNEFLEGCEVYCCESCGWYTFPHEGSGELCSDCSSEEDGEEN